MNPHYHRFCLWIEREKSSLWVHTGRLRVHVQRVPLNRETVSKSSLCGPVVWSAPSWFRDSRLHRSWYEYASRLCRNWNLLLEIAERAGLAEDTPWWALADAASDLGEERLADEVRWQFAPEHPKRPPGSSPLPPPAFLPLNPSNVDLIG